jgi:hypothetical protein
MGVLGFTCGGICVIVAAPLASSPAEAAIYNTIGAILITCCAMLLASMTIARNLSDIDLERLISFAGVTLIGTFQYIFLFVQDTIPRSRTMVMVFMWSFDLPCMLNLKMKSSFILLLFVLVNQILATLATSSFYSDPFPLRFYVLQVVTYVFYLFLTKHHNNATMELFLMEQSLETEKIAYQSICENLTLEKQASESVMEQLEVEKKALESLLNGICDASIWLSGNGDTVVRSERRFDAVVGRKMLNESLSNCLVASERERVMKAMHTQYSGADGPVRLLTTSLKSSSGAHVDMDMFIVDRRRQFLDDCHIPAYLVGIRLHQSPEECPGVSAATGLTHASASSRCRASSQGLSGCLSESSIIVSHEEQDLTGVGACLPIAHPDFKPQDDTAELLEFNIKAFLEEILGCLNFNLSGCCLWHASLEKLATLINEMRDIRSCCGGNPWPAEGSWQCQTCLAVIADLQDETQCWICRAERDPHASLR